MNEQTTQRIQKVLKMLEKTRKDECHCGKVYDMLDEVIELECQGINIEEALPEVAHHLEICGCCRSEYRLLKSICTEQKDT